MGCSDPTRGGVCMRVWVGGVGALHHCSLGAAACSLLFMLTAALLMTSLFQRPSRDILLNNARDLSIVPKQGGRVVLLFTCNWGLVLRSCVNVSVANVTIDYDPPCYSQGVVTSSVHGSFTYTLDEGFPVSTRAQTTTLPAFHCPLG